MITKIVLSGRIRAMKTMDGGSLNNKPETDRSDIKEYDILLINCPAMTRIRKTNQHFNTVCTTSEYILRMQRAELLLVKTSFTLLNLSMVFNVLVMQYTSTQRLHFMYSDMLS